MATTTMKLMTLENLQAYNAKIKQYISDADAKDLKSVTISGNTLKFYKVETPSADTVPAFSIELPETDVSNLLEKFTSATAGDVVTIASDGKIIADSGTKLADLATKNSVNAIENKIGTVTEGKTVVQMINDAQAAATYDDTALSGRVDTVENEIGTLADLNTVSKSDLVSAVNEVRNAVSAGGTSAAITVDTSVTSEGAAKSYTLKQGQNTVAVIDIPKDMVVSSGTVEVDPEGQVAGTYLVLTLANATSDKVYINVGTLVDIYTVKASAAQVQLAINSTTREISATIVAGSITATELGSNAVTTVKIADANVTKAKLAADVQVSLGKADSAVQSVSAGTANGTVAVDGVDVNVTGLGSAAYTASTAYEAAGTVAALEQGQVTTNKTNIATLQDKVSELESTKYIAISDTEIDALFTV